VVIIRIPNTASFSGGTGLTYTDSTPTGYILRTFTAGSGTVSIS
jgi:hypothetical protein